MLAQQAAGGAEDRSAAVAVVLGVVLRWAPVFRRETFRQPLGIGQLAAVHEREIARVVRAAVGAAYAGVHKLAAALEERDELLLGEPDPARGLKQGLLAAARAGYGHFMRHRFPVKAVGHRITY